MLTGSVKHCWRAADDGQLQRENGMYVLLIYFLLAAAVAYDLIMERPQRGIRQWVIYGLVVLFFAVRFSLGMDTGAYSWLFYSVTNPFADAAVSHMMRNFGYTLLNFAVKCIAGEFRWFVLFSNVLILGLCTAVIAKKSVSPLFSLTLLIGGGMLEVYFGSGMRQGIAMALVLFAYYQFLPQKKIIWYELFCLLAFGFQEIAVIAMPVPLLFLLIRRFKAHPYLFTLGGTVIAWLICALVYEFAVNLEWFVVSRVGFEPVWTHIIAYLYERQFSIAGIGMETVFLIGTLLLYRLSGSETKEDFRQFETLTMVFSVLIYYCAACYPLMSRGSDLLQIISLIFLPAILLEIPAKSHRLLAFSAIVVLNAFLLYVDLSEKCRVLSAKENRTFEIARFPYITVFEKDRIEAIYDPADLPD